MSISARWQIWTRARAPYGNLRNTNEFLAFPPPPCQALGKRCATKKSEEFLRFYADFFVLARWQIWTHYVSISATGPVQWQIWTRNVSISAIWPKRRNPRKNEEIPQISWSRNVFLRPGMGGVEMQGIHWYSLGFHRARARVSISAIWQIWTPARAPAET